MDFCLNLSDYPSYWLTCEKSKSRWPLMEKTLEIGGLNSTKIVGPITDPYTIGVSIGHLEALKLSKGLPVIILEDDARITQKYFENIIVPSSLLEQADALYLGTSIFGRVDKVTLIGSTQTSKTESKDIVKVSNMLSMHAILYLSNRYIQHVIELLTEFGKNPIGGVDDAIADSMKGYNVYALASPIFYQNDGHSEYATTYSIGHSE